MSDQNDELECSGCGGEMEFVGGGANNAKVDLNKISDTEWVLLVSERGVNSKITFRSDSPIRVTDEHDGVMVLAGPEVVS